MTLSNWWNRLTQRKLQARRADKIRMRLEELETRCLLDASGFRPIGEVGNNVANPNLGNANTDLLRLSAVAYKDGFSTPSMGGGAPTFVAGSRLVSNSVSNQATVLFGSTDVNTVDQNGLSDFGYTGGQFLDHDMDLTLDGGAAFNIPADTNHPAGSASPDPIGSLLFTRSQFDPD